MLPGSTNNTLFLDHASDILENLTWEVDQQSWYYESTDTTLTNLIGMKKGDNATLDAPIVILGAHYDARFRADKDPDLLNRLLPVPGINDGGSGVAVLLELARVLKIPVGYEIWIVLFDAEDQGGIPGWTGGIAGWSIGSTHFVQQLTETDQDRIELAIIVDLVGSPGLRLTKEGASTSEYVDAIWETGQLLGFNTTFLQIADNAIVDDHRPFLDVGISAVDIIQIRDRDGYAFSKWHHTRNDTIVNVAPESLYQVGRTLEEYLETKISLGNTNGPNGGPDLPFFVMEIVVLTSLILVGSVIALAFWRKRRDKHGDYTSFGFLKKRE